MRSTINSTIKAAERAGTVKPGHEAYAQNELLSFGEIANHSASSIVTSVPQSWALLSSGTIGYATVRRIDNNAYIQVVNFSNTAHFNLTGGTLVSYECMRNAVVTLDGTTYAFSADMDASVTQVKRATLTSTTDAPTVSWSNYGPTFNTGYLGGSVIVRRVEAVCPTAGGVVVAIGTHDFDQQLSTITFFFLPDTSTVIELNAIIQMPLIEAYVSWNGNAHHCCFVSAIYNATTGKVHVFANDQVHGRAVQFSIQTGIESEITPVIPIAAEADLIGLYPASVSLINGTYYLTARFRRKARQGETTVLTSSFDCFLTSPDCVNWSFGTRSFYLTVNAIYGALVLVPGATPYVYYAGNNKAYRAVATKLQTSSSALRLDITNYMEGWLVEQAGSSADSFRTTLVNPPTAGGAGVLDDNQNIRSGSVIYLSAGQSATMGEIGVYGIDENAAAADADEGLSPIDIVARDYGSKRLIDTNLVMELDMEGRVVTQKDLTALDDLWIRTAVNEVTYDDAGNALPYFGVKATSGDGWLYNGANDPLVAYAEGAENGNILMKVRARATMADALGTNYHLSTLGFLFGMNEAGEGNIAMIPKGNGWTLASVTQDRPKVRKLKLNALDPDDPEKLDTGWIFKAGENTLWQSNHADYVRTEAVTGGAYRNTLATSLTADVTYDVAMRVSGRRVQTFWKPVNISETAANWSDAAGYTLRSEYLFDNRTKRSQAGRDWCGVALSTDVPSSTEWWRAGQYGDIVTRMTTVNALYAAPYDEYFSKNIGTCVFGTGSCTSVSLTGSYTLPLGRIFLLLPLSPSTSPAGVFVVASKTSGAQNSNFTVAFRDGLNSTSGAQTCAIFVLGDGSRFGWSSSATRNKLIIPAIGEEYLEITDPGAIKNNEIIVARACYASEDNSAITISYVKTDGVVADIISAAADSGLAWSLATNPIGKDESDVPIEGYSGSSPDEWRIMVFNAMLFEGDPAAYGLPTSAQIYFRVDNEIVRGQKQSFQLPGYSNLYTGCFIPTFYRSLAAIARNSSVLKGWKSPGGAQPGDKFDAVETAMGGSVVGMLVEVIARNTENRPQALQLYATDAYTSAGDDYVALSVPFAGELLDLEAFAVMSTRGQDGTLKETHNAAASVMHYPRNAAGETATMRLYHFDAYSGLYLSVEDALKKLTNLAGVPNATFRNRHTAPTTSFTTTLSTSLTTLPLAESLANFCLDATVHIPGNSTNATGVAGIVSINWIEFQFRGYYKVVIGQFATAANIAAGQYGYIRVGLATMSSEINAGADGERWFEWAPISITDANVSGSYSGTTPNFTLTEDVSKLTDVRIAVQNNEVIVEIAGQHAWTFNLDRYTLSSGVTLRVDNAGPIQVKNKAGLTSYTATFRVQELGDAMPRYTAQMGSTVADAVTAITEARRVRWRATPTGGVEFSRFDLRDDVGPFGSNLWRDAWMDRDLTQRAHVLLAGSTVAGEALSEALIATDGYSFSAGATDRVDTIEGAAYEARLQQREAAEFAETREINGVGLLEAQPEDKITLAYDGQGDAPIHASSDHIVTGLTISASMDDSGNQEVTGRYMLRKFIS